MVAFMPLKIEGGAVVNTALSHYEILRVLAIDETERDDFYGNAVKQKVRRDYALIPDLARARKKLKPEGEDTNEG